LQVLLAAVVVSVVSADAMGTGLAGRSSGATDWLTSAVDPISIDRKLEFPTEGELEKPFSKIDSGGTLLLLAEPASDSTVMLTAILVREQAGANPLPGFTH